MSRFWDRIMGRSSKGSSAVAKDRLEFVLLHDRISLPPEQLAAMKEEILAVISKYVAVDRNHVDIALEQRHDRGGKIVAEIPVAKVGPTIPDTPVEEATSQLADDFDLEALDETDLDETVKQAPNIVIDDEATSDPTDKTSTDTDDTKAVDEDVLEEDSEDD